MGAGDLRFAPKITDQREAVRLYVHENRSLMQIARQFGCAERTVRLMLDRESVPRRNYTATRNCWCGAEADKRVTRGRRKHETVYGTECRRHRLERHNRYQRERRDSAKRNRTEGAAAQNAAG